MCAFLRESARDNQGGRAYVRISCAGVCCCDLMCVCACVHVREWMCTRVCMCVRERESDNE